MLTCWVSLSPELAEFLMHLWRRLEGRRSDRWEVGVTGFFFFIGLECNNGPSKGSRVAEGVSHPLMRC